MNPQTSTPSSAGATPVATGTSRSAAHLATPLTVASVVFVPSAPASAFSSGPPPCNSNNRKLRGRRPLRRLPDPTRRPPIRRADQSVSLPNSSSSWCKTGISCSAVRRVLAYITNQLLRTVSTMNKENANNPQIIFDMPGPERDNPGADAMQTDPEKNAASHHDSESRGCSADALRCRGRAFSPARHVGRRSVPRPQCHCTRPRGGCIMGTRAETQPPAPVSNVQSSTPGLSKKAAGSQQNAEPGS